MCVLEGSYNCLPESLVANDVLIFQVRTTEANSLYEMDKATQVMPVVLVSCLWKCGFLKSTSLGNELDFAGGGQYNC